MATDEANLFWLISVPNRKNGEDILAELNRVCTPRNGQDLSLVNYKFSIPSDLKVGNIDSLISLSDALKKVNLTVEQTLRKIVAAYGDLQKDKLEKEKEKEGEKGNSSNAKAKELTANAAELTRFAWNQARFPVKKPLPELTQMIKAQYTTVEKELREKTVQYNTLKSKISQLEQAQTGSLLTRDLNKDLEKATFTATESEYLTTLYVVIYKNDQKNWLKTYETLTELVVPRSSFKITEDNEYALYSVVLFSRVAEEFKNAARAKKFTVRKNDPSTQLSIEETKNLHSDFANVCQKFEKWAVTNFTDAFSSWVHLKCIQLYVESILRYGLPPEFQAVLLTPKKGYEKKLEKTLCKLYSYLGETYDDNDEDEKDEKTAQILGQEKFFPYVFLELDVHFGARK